MNTNIFDKNIPEVSEKISSILGFSFPSERMDIFYRNLNSAAIGFGFKHLNEFTEWLLSNTLNYHQLEKLAEHFTINETYFWREPLVFSALTDTILPAIVAQKIKSDRKIRIWSAGCSSGEEAYSLAIALYKTIPNIKEWNVKVIATDIDQTVLKKAKIGLYSQWSFRNCPPGLKSQYFKYHGGGIHEINPEIKNLVSFRSLNLVDDSFPSFATDISNFDIIFCRNVLMYFTPEWIQRISHKIIDALQDNGWLVVSSCELPLMSNSQLTSVNFNYAVLHRKSTEKFVAPKPTIEFQLEPIKLITNSKNTKKVIQPEVPHTGPAKVASLSFITEQPKVLASEPMASDAEREIRILANYGHFERALDDCDKAISMDKLNSGLYFLRASILQELQESEKAVASLKQAIYLDSNFVIAHFTIGNLFIQLGKEKNAKIAFKNTLDLLTKWPDDHILPDSEGLSVQYLREIILSGMPDLPNR